MKIPLFDIDGTLVKTQSPINRQVVAYAAKKVYGIDAQQTEINPEGMTDNQIITEILKLHGLTAEEVKEKITEEIQAVTDYVNEHKNEIELEILPGVRKLLTNLKSKQIPMGVLTGNVEGLAWAKLERAGIKEFFDFGAFGSQAFKRIELVEIARKNAEKALKKTFQIQDFIIVGDTPRDIWCARDAGIKVAIVATGLSLFEELAEEKPDLLVRTLEDKRVFNFITE
jgi:phosphoglycolate phosphatase-like HAD superfamily hydrolase